MAGNRAAPGDHASSRGAGLLRDERLCYAILLIGAAAAALFLVAPFGGLWQAMAFFVPWLLAVFALALRVRRPEGVRSPWVVLLSGVLFYAGGVVIWYYGPVLGGVELPFPSPLDAVFFSTYALYAVFLLTLIRAMSPESRLERRLTLIDSVVFACGITAVLWVAVIAPNLDAGLPILVTGVAVLYPAFQVLLFALAVRVSMLLRSWSGALILLFVWIGAELVGDVFYGFQSANGRFSYDSPLLAAWLISLTALAAFAVHPGSTGLLNPGTTSRRPKEAQPHRRGHWYAGLVVAALVLVPLCLAAVTSGEDVVLLGVAAVMFTVTMYRGSLVSQQLERVIGSLRENRLELADLHASVTAHARGLAGAQRIASVGSWEWDLVTDEVTWSDEMRRIVGVAEDAAVSVDMFLAAVHAEDRAEVAQHLDRAVEHRSPLSFETRIVLPGGGLRWIAALGEFTSTDAEVLRMTGTVQDITDHRRTEELLRNNEERYRLVTLATQEVVWDCDLVRGRTTWRGAVGAMFGYDGECLEFDIDWWEDKLHPDERARVLASQDEVFRSGAATWVKEYQFRTRSGDYASVLARGYVTRDADGRPVRFVGSMMDVTDRNRYEEELRVARRHADQASEAKSMFLANMSHEIRTPLTPVLGLTELLLDTDLNARQRSFAETVHRSAGRLLNILNDILDFSKIEAGRMSVDSVVFGLHDLIREASTLPDSAATDKGIEMSIDIAEDVPPVVIGDPLRLHQVLGNLLGNAVKFTDQGKIRLVVESRPGPEVPALHIMVSDTGVGLDADTQSRLFTSFTQADGSATRRHGGTGLGLAISKQLVQLMGGSISVESRPGHGSTFSFTLPLNVPEGDLLTSDPPTKEPAQTDARFHPHLVEDRPVDGRGDRLERQLGAS